MAAETQFTANTGMATINAANTSLTGTGTLNTDIWCVLTAGANGTKIVSVTVKAKGSTTAEGMVRLFINDGSSTRLIAEIEVDVVTQSAQDECFEKYLPLDLDLKAGDKLYATTQIADTFNIIAEGLDWAYLTNVRPDSTNYTANTGVGLISVANSNLDGTGTVVTVFTAGTAANGYKGARIKSIIIKAIVSTGTTTDGMVRLFIQDTGSTTKLFTEVFVPMIKPTATNRSFVHQIDFGGGLDSQDGGFNLAPGYKIIASTELGNSFTVTVEALDWNYPANGGTGILGKNFSPASVTGTLTETILHSFQIGAGLISTGDLLEVNSSLAETNNANNKTFKMYVNTSNAIAGATLLATLTDASFASTPFQRFMPVISDTALECYGSASTSLRAQYGTSAGASANVTVPSLSAGVWIIISCTLTNTGDTGTARWTMVTNSRQ
ncbi:MAG: hypothetical protein ACXVPU_13520 [Bacteroidia bacterium]